MKPTFWSGGRIGPDLVWGVRWGLMFALALAIVAAVSLLVLGGSPSEKATIATFALGLLFYFTVGPLIGALVGLFRPYLDRLIGRVVVGAVSGSVVYVMVMISIVGLTPLATIAWQSAGGAIFGALAGLIFGD